MLVALLARGHVLLEGVPGVAKTLAVETLATGRRRHVRPPAVHPRPGARRHHRHPHLQGRPGRLRHRARPGVRQLRAHRRDQPRAGQGAVGAAGGHGRAAGLHRRRHPPAARPVPRAGHPEPDRVRGRLPAARGAARPLPDEGARRLPDARRRSGRSSTGWAPSRRWPRRCSAPTSCAGCSRPPRRSSCTTRWSTTSSGWSSPPAPRASTAWRTSPRWVSYGASPRASLGLIAAGRALALVRGRDYVLPQDVLDVTADVLRHRLVLSYDALADGVPADHIVQADRADRAAAAGRAAPARRRLRARHARAARTCRTFGRAARQPGPHAAGASSRPARAAPGAQRARTRAAARRDPASPPATPSTGRRGPAAPRASCCTRPPPGLGGRAAGRSGDGAPPRFADGPRRRAAAPAGADRPAAAGRAAAGRPPRPGARLGLARPATPARYHPGDDVRRMDWPVTARTQVPHVRETIADRELETWAVRRPVGQPGLRHRQLPEARPGDRRARRGRPPHRARRQPARRRRHHRRAGRPVPGAARAAGRRAAAARRSSPRPRAAGRPAR